MKNIFKFSSILTLSVSVLPFSAFAANLIVAKGVVSRPCSETADNLVSLAKENALKQLSSSSNFQQISQWQTWTNYFTSPLPPNICYSGEGTAVASFVSINEINEDWYVTVDGLSHVKDSDEFDEEGWKLAFENSAVTASQYCGTGGAEKTPISSEKIKKQSIKNVWRIFMVSARYKCHKSF